MNPTKRNAYAVVIGIDNYQDSLIPDLTFARADAEGIYQTVTNAGIVGIPPENVILLLDEEATQRNIRSAIGTKIPRRVGEHDLVYIYYAGHGSPLIDPKSGASDGMEKYLVPVDAELDDLRATGISMDEIRKFFGWIESRQVIFFIDSCYSGQAGGRTFPHPHYQTRAALTSEFLDKLSGEGRVVITACDVNEVSLEIDEIGHGVFTHYLMKGLTGLADRDRDAQVTIHELYEYVYEEVSRHARSLGGSMHPVQKGSVKGRIFLTQPADGEASADKNIPVEKQVENILAKHTSPKSKSWLRSVRLQSAKKFFKTKTGILLSAIATLAAVASVLFQALPFFQSAPELEKYLALQSVTNFPDTLFVSLYENYAQDSLLFIQMRSDSSKKIQAELQFEIEWQNDPPLVSKKVLTNNFQSTAEFTLPFPSIKEALVLEESQTAKASAKVVYQTLDGKPVEHVALKSENVEIVHKNYVDLSDPILLSAFLTPNDPQIRRLKPQFDRVLTEQDTGSAYAHFGEELLTAINVYHWMKQNEIFLDRDLHGKDTHYLQFPIETLNKKAGASNDLAVLYATLLLANNVSASVLPVFDHVIVFVNTGVSQENYFFLTPSQNPDYYSIDARGVIWLAIDMNAFDRSFQDAWLESRNYDLPKEITKDWSDQQRRGAVINEQWNFTDAEASIQSLIAAVKAEAESWIDYLKTNLENRNNELSLQQLALMSLATEDTTAARQYLNQCLTLNPRSAETHYLLGRAYFEEKDYSNAINHFTQATDLDPNMAKAYLRLACCYKAMNRTEQARSAFAKGKALDAHLAEQARICNPDI